MNNWFTIEKIDDNTFVINEYMHWEETHCYLLMGDNKALLIDTGLGVSNIKEVVENLTDKPILVVTTHVHIDHIGGHKYFNNIAVYKDEVEWLSNFPIPLDLVKKNLLKEPCNFPNDFDINKYEVFKGCPTLILKDSDIIDLGNRKIRVIHTPGHSPGHICLYEKDKGYLFTGDLIYKGTLYAFYPSTDPIEFMNSIKKLTKLDVKRILPGHHDLNIQNTIIKEIDEAFTKLYSEGKLKQGNGIFKFNNFSIHI